MEKRNNKKYTLLQLQALFEDFKPEAILDFHEFGILNSDMIIDIYNTFIKESILSSQKNVLIITGKGEVVKPLVERTLRKDPRISSFNTAGNYQGGKGAFEVTLL